MFFEIAIGIKTFVLLVSLVGLFLGLFPDLPKTAQRQSAVVEQQPEIDNVWSALVYAPDDAARDDIEQVHKEQQITERQHDDNAARVQVYQSYSTQTQTTLTNTNQLLLWGLVGMVAVAVPLPKRRKQEVPHVE